MTQESYENGYRYGVKIALDTCGIVKTAAVPEFMQKALEMAGKVPSWAKGMGAGAAAGGGLGAVAGDDYGDILSGAAGGAAAGGLIGGAPALGQKISPKIQKLLERFGGGDVGAMRGEAAGFGQAAAGEKAMAGKLWDQGLPGAGQHAWQQAGKLTGEQNAALELMQGAAGEQAGKLSPRLMQALGIGAGGAGVAGAMGD